jgi:hypothetical protein
VGVGFAGLALAPVLAALGAAGFVGVLPVAVGVAAWIVAVRSPAVRRPLVTALAVAAVTAVVLYVSLLVLAVSAIPDGFEEAM